MPLSQMDHSLFLSKNHRALSKAKFGGHKVWVRHHIGATDVLENALVKFARELETASTAKFPPFARRFVTITHTVGIGAVSNALRLAFISLGYCVCLEVLAENAAQSLGAVVQVLAERFEAARSCAV
jgi:hypothetical protein